MNSIEILEQKYSMGEMKNATENINSKIDQLEEIISEIEDRNFEIVCGEKKKDE